MAILACGGVMVSCGRRETTASNPGGSSPPATRILSAAELLGPDHCEAHYGVPLKLDYETTMGSNPPTLELDHVTTLHYLDADGQGRAVYFALDQSVSVEESRRRFKERRELEAKDSPFEPLPDLGEGEAYLSGKGQYVHFLRGPYSVTVQATEIDGAWNYSREVALGLAREIDERLKRQLVAPAAP